jgi:hypothetical protein
VGYQAVYEGLNGLEIIDFITLLKNWLPFLDTYRTMCLTPEPQFRRVLDEIRNMKQAA